MSYSCIQNGGGPIPAEILEEIASGEAAGYQLSDFWRGRSAHLTEEIAAAWTHARAYWEAFQRGRRRLGEDDPATTVTREQWVFSLLRSLSHSGVGKVDTASTHAVKQTWNPE